MECASDANIEEVLTKIALKIGKSGHGCIFVIMCNKFDYAPLLEQDIKPFKVAENMRRAEAVALLDGSCIISPDGNLIAYSANILNVKNYIGYGTRHCLKEDTEVLSSEGWKKYNQLKLGENIFTLNLTKDEIELKPIRKIHKYDFEGNLIHIKNKFLDFFVTPEHKALVRLSHREGNGNGRHIEFDYNWKLIEYKDLLGLPNLKVKHRLAGIKREGLSIGISKAGLLGWILTDASISKRDKSIIISQSWSANKDKCMEIKNLLKLSGLSYTEHLRKQKGGFSKGVKEMMYFRISTKDSKWIFDWINEDRTPKWKLLQLKSEELLAIYNNIMLGDGTRPNERWAGELCTQNLKRIEFFRALCVLINKNTKLVQDRIWNNGYTDKIKWRTHVNNYYECNTFRKEFSEQKYKGIVWCPETINQTVIARSNDKVFITGNSAAYTASQNGNTVILASEEDSKVRIFKDGKLLMELDPFAKNIEKNTKEAISILESVGVGALSAVGVAILAPAIGISLIPGILIFGSSHYAFKLVGSLLDKNKKEYNGK